MRISKANRKAIEYACRHFHYSKSVPSVSCAYNVFNSNDEWCGVIIFASGANNAIGKQYELVQGQILELVRVALNGQQEHTSQAVAMTLKELHKDKPMCRLVVSYADCDQSHLGTIYQATNWVYVGTMMQDSHDSSWVVNGKRYHGRNISDWVRNRGGYKDLHAKSLSKSITTQTQNNTSPRAKENISCQWTSKCESRYNHWRNHTRKTMIG